MQEFIENHSQTLLDMESSGLVVLINHEKYEDIALLYDLFKRVPKSFELLRQQLQEFIIKQGTALITDEKLANEDLVQKLI